jgi:hypothetical protein
MVLLSVVGKLLPKHQFFEDAEGPLHKHDETRLRLQRMFSSINHHQTCSKTNDNIQLLEENHLHAVLARILIDTDIMINLFFCIA